jgi:hypothetical protein
MGQMMTLHDSLCRFLFRELVVHFTHRHDWWQALELAIESEGWKVSARSQVLNVLLSCFDCMAVSQCPQHARGLMGMYSQIVLLLRLTPLVPFNLLNYALGCTVVSSRSWHSCAKYEASCRCLCYICSNAITSDVIVNAGFVLGVYLGIQRGCAAGYGFLHLSGQPRTQPAGHWQQAASAELTCCHSNHSALGRHDHVGCGAHRWCIS